jgi:hypothetical protein
MNEELKKQLTPDDDGRAFTDAVMLRAAGALHRRRAAAEALAQPAWDWLALWARPWVVASLIAIAGITIIFPVRSVANPPSTATAVSADSEAMVASLLPADMALASSAEAIQER